MLGTLAAWGLTRLRFRGRGLVAGLHGAVLVVPWLIIGVAGLIFFSQLGVALSLQTVGLMQLVVTFPLVVAIVSAGLVRFSRSQEEAAIDLGATQAQMIRHVVLPQIAPSLAAAAIFAFAWSFNNFEISFFNGGFEQTFPVWVFGDPAAVREPAGRQRRLDGDRGRPGHRRVRRLGADQAALDAATAAAATRRSAELMTGGGALMESASLPRRAAAPGAGAAALAGCARSRSCRAPTAAARSCSSSPRWSSCS